jgi:hypothetical protein
MRRARRQIPIDLQARQPSCHSKQPAQPPQQRRPTQITSAQVAKDFSARKNYKRLRPTTLKKREPLKWTIL